MSTPDRAAVHALLGPDATPCRRGITGEHGVALPPLGDHHVHLHLIDAGALTRGGVAAVVDLGGDPVELARLPRDGMPQVAYAGAFLTVPGGYPSGRVWAPPRSVHVVTNASEHPGVAGGAATAVDAQAEFGAAVIKVTLNAAAGPVFDRPLLDAVVGAAHAHDRPVVAHVEGPGMTLLALEAGVDALAHTPFTERLDPRLIARAIAAGQVWISTLAIHTGPDRDRAVANLAAFAAAGGRVLYGTDLGNGERSVGIQTDELAALHAAGVRGPRLVAALTDPWPLPARLTAVATFVPGEPPATLDDVPAWFAGATVVPDEELIRDDN